MAHPLSEDDIEAIAKSVTKMLKESGCSHCRFNKKESEWVHTGAKYVASTRFPLMGKVLQLLDEAENEIGKWVIRSLFFLGIGGGIILILHKTGVIK
jgi:hypothetical protein